jgi:hypothetical protein
MAGKADFTEDEWKTLHRGVTGAGMLVSASDASFMDTFGEASALTKKLRSEGEASQSQLVRDLAATGGVGFGLTSSREKVETETLDALKASIALLGSKAPDDEAAYRQLVLDVAEAVAEARHGVSQAETDAIGKIKEAVGAT